MWTINIGYCEYNMFPNFSQLKKLYNYNHNVYEIGEYHLCLSSVWLSLQNYNVIPMV